MQHRLHRIILYIFIFKLCSGSGFGVELGAQKCLTVVAMVDIYFDLFGASQAFNPGNK